MSIDSSYPTGGRRDTPDLLGEFAANFFVFFLASPSPPAKTGHMKKIIAFVTLAAFHASSAYAWVGGPWSSNTHDNHTTGLFGGTITMKNGSGIFRFSSTDTAQMGAFNSSMIYYKGVTFLGSCQANVDFNEKTVDGITNGSASNRSPASDSTADTPAQRQ